MLTIIEIRLVCAIPLTFNCICQRIKKSNLNQISSLWQTKERKNNKRGGLDLVETVAEIGEGIGICGGDGKGMKFQ